MSDKDSDHPDDPEVPDDKGIEERPPDDSDEEEFQALAAVSSLTPATEEAPGYPST